MARVQRSNQSLLVIACFSRHPAALSWAAERLEQIYGPVALTSKNFDFNHTAYYEKDMGPGLLKRFVAFSNLVPADSLADIKNRTIALEGELAETHSYHDLRPLNLDPGILQLGKFILATI